LKTGFFYQRAKYLSWDVWLVIVCALSKGVLEKKARSFITGVQILLLVNYSLTNTYFFKQKEYGAITHT
jgi:hypothetical protein